MVFVAHHGDPSRLSSNEYTDSETLGSNDRTLFSSEQCVLICGLIVGKQALGERGVCLLYK